MHFDLTKHVLRCDDTFDPYPTNNIFFILYLNKKKSELFVSHEKLRNFSCTVMYLLVINVQHLFKSIITVIA